MNTPEANTAEGSTESTAAPADRSAVAERLRPFGTTVFAEITQRAVAAKAVNLGQGFPDRDGPEFIKDAMSEAMRRVPNQYAPMPGVPELRAAVAHRFNAATGLPADPDAHVTVTAGCTEAIPAAFMGLIDAGREVILFEPFYDAYPVACALAGAKPVYVPLREQADVSFAFDEKELRRAAARPGVKAIMLNTPHNPTGKVFSRAELETVAAVAREHDLIVISDEVYERLMFDGAEHVSIASLDGMWERTVTLSSFGKTYSLTGWKLGWAVGPERLTAGVRAAHQYLTYAVNTPAQHAAAAAITSPQGEAFVADQARQLAASRDRLGEALTELGFRFRSPRSGYFILADHSAISEPRGISDDRAFVKFLIDECGVAAIPPSAFYSTANAELAAPLVRFAFCKTPETIDAAIERLGTLRG